MWKALSIASRSSNTCSRSKVVTVSVSLPAAFITSRYSRTGRIRCQAMPRTSAAGAAIALHRL